MAADRSYDAEVPSADHPNPPADRPDAPADHGQPSRREQIEPPSREEAWTAALRHDAAAENRTEPAIRSEPEARSNPPENGQETSPNASREKTADKPPAEHPDRSPDRPQAPADEARLPGRPPAEPPSREDRFTDLRADTELHDRTEPAGPSEPGARSKPAEPIGHGHQPQAGDTWEDKADLARWIWGEYKRKWSDEERPPVDQSRTLSHEVNIQLDEEYERIAERERDTISPRMCEVESRDPNRHLVGFEHRLKDLDRIKEKIYDDIDLLGRSPHEAISLVPDAIRFTFQYDEARYTQGVWTDIVYMKEQGFVLEKLKNTWSDDQYKGINSQWIEPDTGQRFELQFHTRISVEAKEITHKAYERIRTHQANAFEELVLEAIQRKVTASVPIPPGATGIPDYSEGEWHGR